MMEDLKIHFKEFIIKLTNKITKSKNYGINIVLLMIWLLIWLNQMEDLFGHAKIMMVMFNLIP